MMGFDEWNATMRTHCGHYYGEPGSNVDPGGQFLMHTRQGIDIAEIHCAIDRIQRTRCGIRQDDSEHLFLLLQLQGTSGVIHGNNEQQLTPGACLLLDSTLPVELRYDGQQVQFLSAHLPRALYLEGRGQPAIGQRIDETHPLSHTFRMLLDPASELTSAQNGFELLTDLVGLAFGPPQGARDAMRIRDRGNRYRFITSTIDRMLTDPTLTIDRLAAEVHMSRRQLQRDFRDHGTSFSAYLQCQRLKYTAERLRQAARLGHDPSISGLAYEAGFGDISHFNRAFRQRYDAAPRAFLQMTRERLQPN